MLAIGLTSEKYLSDAEQAHLVGLLKSHHVAEPRNTALLWFMLKTGGRPQEVLNVTWGDLNFTPGKQSVIFRTLKGGDTREVPMRKGTVDMLRPLIPALPDPTARVFNISYRRFVQIWWTYRPVKKPLHCLRHTFAVNVFNKTENLRIVQYLLGHRSLLTTEVYLRIYYNLTHARRFMED